MKENIKKRLEEIEGAIARTNGIIQQTMANLNVLEGGRQECLYWIKHFETIEQKEIEDASNVTVTNSGQ